MALVLQIESLAAGGDGLARADGQVIFVQGGIPGDRVEVEVSAQKPPRARILRLLEPSPDRVEPSCPHFGGCGGCQWLNVRLEAQQRAKEQIFYEALQRIGGIGREDLEARPILPSEKPLHYRMRARLHLAGGVLGYAERASHQIVPVRGCPLLDERLESAIERVREAFSEVGPVSRCTDVSFACDARRVTAAFHVEEPRKSAAEQVERVMRRARLDGAVLAPEKGPATLFGKALLSFPAPYAPGVTLYARADLFAQANAETNGRLVAEALELLDVPGLASRRPPPSPEAAEGAAQPGAQGAEPRARILELFCGAGNFTFGVARQGAQVVAVETAGDALELARRSAREARLGTVRFIAADALKTAEALAKEGQRFDALVLDPPRTGAKGVGRAARQLGVRRVVYVSCDPATLARDARELVDAGFRPRVGRPVDMFPQTFHVEGVLLLERT